MATSPAAKTPGTLVSSRSSATIPLSISSPAASASAVRGTTPMPTTTRSQCDRVRRRRAAPPRPAVALEALDGGAGEQLDAVLAVDVGVDRADLAARARARAAPRRARRRSTSTPLLPGRGGDLGADPAGPDHDDPRRLARAPPRAGRSRRGRAGSGPRRGRRRAGRAGAARLRSRAAAGPSRSARRRPSTTSARAGRRSPRPGAAVAARCRCSLVEAVGMDVGCPRVGSRRAGSPSTAAGARRAAPARRRSGRSGRRSPRSRSVSAAFAPARPAPTITTVCRRQPWDGPSGQARGTPAGARIVAERPRSARRDRAWRPACWTPRRVMHMCSASITTPTPAAPSSRSIQPAICVVSRSCTCSDRAKSSTTRASFERPTIRSPGR